MSVKAVRKSTVVEGVIEDLKGLLRRRQYGAGKRLPGERVLAKDLGVSRPSLREALRTLERMGVLSTRHGSGTHVAESGAEVLRAPLEFLFMLEKPAVADLHETRTLLEIHLAGRAAERRTDPDLLALETALAEMKGSLENSSRLTEPDLRFHQALAAAAHNPVLERLMNCLRDAVAAMIRAAWPGAASLGNTYEIHARIARAVRDQDADGARRAMERHMDFMTEELRQVKLLP